MTTPQNTKQHLFTILGVVKEREGKKHFASNSKTYFQDRIDKLAVGLKVKAEFFESKTTRSEAQLSYYWVLCNYIAEYNGNTKEEIHDALMKLKFGTKRIVLMGKEVEVRKSISNKAQFPKYMMVELVEFALETCKELEIKVPTKQELGYIDN